MKIIKRLLNLFSPTVTEIDYSQYTISELEQAYYAAVEKQIAKTNLNK